MAFATQATAFTAKATAFATEAIAFIVEAIAFTAEATAFTAQAIAFTIARAASGIPRFIIIQNSLKFAKFSLMFPKNTIENDVSNQYMMLYIICQAILRLYYYVESNEMTNLREIFAYNLKEKRRKCGFSQAKLAEMVSVSTHHIATIETARNYPTLDLVERMANALGIEIYELFINPLSPPEEMERLYQVASKNIERLICDSMERFCQKTAKSLEHIVGESVEKVLADKFNDKK